MSRSNRSSLRAGVAALLSVSFAVPVLMSCNDDGVSPRGGGLEPVAEVVIEPAVVSVLLDESVQLTAIAKDPDGVALTRTITWTSSQPDIAAVSSTGLVTGKGAGIANVTASAGGITGLSEVTVNVGVEELAITTVLTTLGVGEQMPMSVQVRCRNGRQCPKVTWTSSDENVAGVDEEGVVTGLSRGSAVIRAEAENVSDELSITVGEPAATIIITKEAVEEEDRPVMVGGTMQLLATVRDAVGNTLGDRQVIWSSGNEALATIDQEGLVTGVARGLATITARSGNASGTLELRVAGSGSGGGGGGEEGLGNNLSVPLVFAEPVGMTGLPVLEDPGLRPMTEEGVVATSNPFWFDGNTPDCGAFFCQQGESTWRAEWRAATPGDVRSAQVSFGDNLTHHGWNTHAPIRVEVTLWDLGGLMQGFAMPYTAGSMGDEMYGTNGVLEAMQPTIYTPTARLIIQKLENYDLERHEGQVSATITDIAIWENFGAEGPGQFKAEVNVAGRVIYGYSFVIRDVVLPNDLHKYGWWRITFALDSEAGVGGAWHRRNASLDALRISTDEEEPLLYTPRIDTANQRAFLDIYVESASGGGGGGTHK
jgi:hypothetical protein